MDEIRVICDGVLIGFLASSVSCGPVAAFYLRRTLQDGRLADLLSGLGAAVVDAFFGLLVLNP